MTLRFHPLVEFLEIRDVPAAFSFQLPNGTIGSGQFTMPTDDVNAALSFQEILLSDVELTIEGATAAATGTPEAIFEFGVFQGVAAGIPAELIPASYDGVGLAEGFVTGFDLVAEDVFAVPVVYDTADTQITFQLPDGTAGAISFNDLGSQVDSTQASQSIPLTTFTLNIAGQNFSYGSASFTTSPSALFENGAFKGLNFVLDTSGIANFPYTALSMSSLTVTADLQAPGLPIETEALAKPKTSLSRAVPGPAAGQVAVDYRWDDCAGAQTADITVYDANNNVVGIYQKPLQNKASGGFKNESIATNLVGGNVKIVIEIKDVNGNVLATATKNGMTK
jgi:hypothetical protein